MRLRLNFFISIDLLLIVALHNSFIETYSHVYFSFRKRFWNFFFLQLFNKTKFSVINAQQKLGMTFCIDYV